MGFPDTDTLVMTAVVMDIAMPSGSSIRKKEHKKQEEREGERERGRGCSTCTWCIQPGDGATVSMMYSDMPA